MVVSLIPSFFIHRATLVLQASFKEILFPLMVTLVGSVFMAGALAGYLLVYGPVRSTMERVMMFTLGLALIIPTWMGPAIGAGFLFIAFVLRYMRMGSSRGDAVSYDKMG